VLPLALLLGLAVLVRWLGAKLRLGAAVRRLAGALLVWAPLSLSLGIPLAVALRPAGASGAAARWLERVRLLEPDAGPGGGHHPRGAAAQLAKLLHEAPPFEERPVVAEETGHVP
jgi:hypothetical protein